MEAFLDVKHLSGGYPDFQLNDVGFSLPKGSLTGIIGPNGSGKTTLMKALLGEVRTTGGRILLGDVDLKQLSLREKAKRVAVVTQLPAEGSMTVQEYVVMGRMPYRKSFQFFETRTDLEKADYYMKRTGVHRYRNHLLSELSGGERQLVSITRALVQEPVLLMLDEPTSMLDISHQIQVMDLVRDLTRQAGLTVLMIVHDLNLAGAYCDRLLLMHEGSLHTDGSPSEVLRYDVIEAVYRTVVVTRENPVTGRPAVFPIPGHVLPKLERQETETVQTPVLKSTTPKSSKPESEPVAAINPTPESTTNE